MKVRKILALAGLIGSGKDTAAGLLIEHHHFVKMAFADTLKDACAAIFGWDRLLLDGGTAESRTWREMVDTWWARRLGIPHLTPRWALQHIGTGVFREYFHQDIWIASLERRLEASSSSVVITDCRFPNELGAIEAAGGATVRIYRGADPPWLQLAQSDHQRLVNEYPHVHASEYSSVGWDYHHYINNNSDIADLHAQLRAILRQR